MRSSPADFELMEAENLDHALAALNRGEGWRPISGGTDIMVLFNAGVLSHHRLVSIREIPELNEIVVGLDSVRIGAAVNYAVIQRSEVLRKEFPLLCQAATWTGSVANQNRGTLGGNIANGSPAADSPPALLAYDADLEIVSSEGSSKVAYRDFHTGYKAMKLPANALILAIHLKRTSHPLRHYARKVGARKAQAISKVSFHGVADMDGRSIRSIRIALGSVAPYPLRCRAVERLLQDQALTESLIDAAEQKLSEEIRPIDDIRSTAAYRLRVSQNLLREFLESLL